MVDRAVEILGIDEGLHDEERMSIGGLPGGAESRDQAAQRRRTEVRHRALRQEEKTDIVGDQSEAATALLIGPPDPLIAGPQMPGGRRKDQHRHAGALRVGHRLVQLLADRLHAAKIVPGDEQGLCARAAPAWRAGAPVRAQKDGAFFRERRGG